MKDWNASFRRGWAGLRSLIRRLLLILPLAGLIGSACAFFLWSLDAVTGIRFDHPWLLFLLPVGGFAVGWIYHRLGRSAEGGNLLIIEQIHTPGGGVPRRMAPLVLFGTLVTHLLGGSAGREGTAVQMGGSLASGYSRALRLEAETTRLLLMTGIAAGFGAVFGTPLAGAIFAVEVLGWRRLQPGALLPCWLAAVIGDWTCLAWGIGHTHYAIQAGPSETLASGAMAARWLKVALASVAFGLTAWCFVRLSHGVSAFMRRRISYAPLRPVFGGVAVIALWWLAGTSDYLGLGVWSRDPHALTISSFFSATDYHPWSWGWKILFTIATVATGFKGGEVTPLFFVGAALGHALSAPLGLPPDLLAGLGFVAVFAGAAKTPLACAVMGIELFGTATAGELAIACLVAFGCSGRLGLYRAAHPLPQK